MAPARHRVSGLVQRRIDTLKNTYKYTIKVSNLVFFMEFLVLIGRAKFSAPPLIIRLIQSARRTLSSAA